ncbi:aromatic ring-hydroxylating dioxygenase subunit alpha [Hydrogenophaga sp. 2FB]|uniref:aromatic ring-hydroxylating oxygenase subunit alpha n=1 Tax=Hydrogenophaga sp. 2FB TaxID=2502187 RepID=UPI0010F9F0E8|nr:aromatic ring-hydroxylating dioxygenase subunit alpha [Hydrogenophaga sp. 2FB]
MSLEEATLKTDATQRVERGLLNYWYPVLPSYRLAGTAIGITRLSEEIALWRDDDGKVRAVEDRCPHRGARLSLGWNLGDRVACWYHGVQVDGQGKVVDVPAMENCALKGRTCLKSYPAVEANGAIFLWFGDGTLDTPAPFELPEEMTSDAYSGFLCMQNWKCNHRYAIDNVMDPMHGTYLHSQSHSMAEGDRQAEMTVRPTDTGLIVEKVGQRGVNFDWVEFGESGMMWMRLAVPYSKQHGGGQFIIVGFVTPVDDKHCQVYFWRIRKAAGFDKNIWHFLYKNRLEGLHWDVLEQDRLVIESLSRSARSQESLYQHDVGIVRVRRWMEKRAQEQVAQRRAVPA